MLLGVEENINMVEWRRPAHSSPIKGNFHITLARKTSNALYQVLRLQKKFMPEYLVCASHLPLRTMTGTFGKLWGKNDFQVIFIQMRHHICNVKFCQSLRGSSILGTRFLRPELRITHTWNITQVIAERWKPAQSSAGYASCEVGSHTARAMSDALRRG